MAPLKGSWQRIPVVERSRRVRNLVGSLLKELDEPHPLKAIDQSKDIHLNNMPCTIHYGAEWEAFNVQIHTFGCTKTPTQSSGQSEGKLDRSWNARSVYLSLRNLNPIYRNKGYPESKVWKKHNLGNMAFSIEDFTVPEDQVKHAKEIFKRFDKRSQEKINTNDLGPAFTALNLTVKPDQLKEWADEVDEDATGFIDMNGFLIVYAKKLREDQDEKDLREAFRVLDKNKRGEIDVEDLRWILKGLGDDLTEEEIDDMIRDTDTDGSGFVDFDEFYKLMTSE